MPHQINPFANVSEDEVEFIDPESEGFSNKTLSFSHESLVMQQYDRVLKALSKEMVEGFWSEKPDKYGQKHLEYTNDTRREAIEAIITLKNCTISDLTRNDTSKYYNKITKLLKEIESIKSSTTNTQKEWFNSLPPFRQKQLVQNAFCPDILNDKFPFYHYYINESLAKYRLVLEQIELMLREIYYYEKGEVVVKQT